MNIRNYGLPALARPTLDYQPRINEGLHTGLRDVLSVFGVFFTRLGLWFPCLDRWILFGFTDNFFLLVMISVPAYSSNIFCHFGQSTEVINYRRASVFEHNCI